MPAWITHEPARWLGLITAIVDLAIVFGAPITPEQRAAVLGVGGAVLAMIGAEIVRANVTPTARIDQVPVAKQALERAEAAQ